MLLTPVAFFIFNRPDLTKRVFSAIRRARPQTLLVISDGPRSEDERELVIAARRVIEEGVDWDCNVLWNKSEINQGCRLRVSSGIDWVFEQVEEAILLEDDCLPHPDFFLFCEEMLVRYRMHSQVMMVSGQSFWSSDIPVEASYFFSKNVLIWGWASWRRAWQLNQLNMPTWPTVRESSLLQDLFENPKLVRKLTEKLDAVFQKQIDTWDLQWGYSIWLEDGLVVVPYTNMVANIGFGADSTNTKKAGSRLANYPASSIKLPLIHPDTVAWQREHDRLLRERVSFLNRPPVNLLSRMKRRVSKWVRELKYPGPNH